MRTTFLTNQLEKNLFQFQHLLSNLSKEEYTWKLNDEKWSLLQIVCHLHDEEREDFRARVKLLLENPEKDWVPIDPVAWVKDRKYNEQSFVERLQQFITEREHSVAWLRSLDDTQWNNAKEHPHFGTITPYFFLSNWVAHDYLHLRQIIRVKYDYVNYLTDVNLEYAGEWK